MTNTKIRFHVFRIILSTALFLNGLYFTYKYSLLVQLIDREIITYATRHGGLRELYQDQHRYTHLMHVSLIITIMVAVWVILEFLWLIIKFRINGKHTDT